MDSINYNEINRNKWTLVDSPDDDFVLISKRKPIDKFEIPPAVIREKYNLRSSIKINKSIDHDSIEEDNKSIRKDGSYGHDLTDISLAESTPLHFNGSAGNHIEKNNGIHESIHASSKSYIFGKSFKELGVPDWLIELSRTLSIKAPTKIQELCLPLAFNGCNVIGCSQTGTGKTICFCWPILVSLMSEPYGVYALVLTSSRELAYQIGDQFRIFGVRMNISVCVCVGGVDVIHQSLELERRPHIVVATPGRLADQVLIPERNISSAFRRVKYLVLDEADKLLTKCFQAPLQVILQCIPRSVNGRITHLYSATITHSILLLSKTFNDIKFHFFDVTEGKGQTSIFTELRIAHYYAFLPQRVHLTYLVHLLQKDFSNPKQQGIIFVATRYRCQLISITLGILKFNVTCIHSNMKQRARNASLAKFRSGHCQLLVATDLVSRGIDIPSVEFVINLDFPLSPQDYVHRVGRCGRAGKQGLTISFIDDKDISKIKSLEDNIDMKLDEYKIIDKEATKLLNKVSIAKQKATVLLEEIADKDS